MKIGIFGNNRDRMPDMAFRAMSCVFALRDRICSPWSVLDEFGIEPGRTVVDYGCGPGSYLGRASELVGPAGTVFAVDTHKLAVGAVMRRTRRQGLGNVTAVRADGNSSSLPDATADVIYALDMFHMVSDPAAFLGELNRICKPGGALYISNGHQTREAAKAKILSSGAWEIIGEKRRFLKCRPVRPQKQKPGAAEMSPSACVAG
jgi:SAM-dependent methyltransferase